MELREFFKFIKRNSRLILAGGAVFLALGLGLAFLWPVQFEATGHLFVGRETAVSGVPNEYFDYEGYYAQQTAQNYTPTVIAFLESDDVLNLAMEEVGISLSEATLRPTKRSAHLRQAGPQMIEVRVTHSSAASATKFWEVLVGAGLERWAELEGTITVAPVTAVPLVARQELPIPLAGVVSVLMGLMIGGLAAAGKEYFG
ncbi:Wzz/FepE/Etk N-terminal domain-containing protein [Candidatus Parcubacteria bacterium]|nr:Wzz/FepE/Etk N-terminal domain-containing protein [Candidatus Parcubacteria bacterium]